MIPPRDCAECGRTIPRRPDESDLDYQRRRYCSRPCFQTAAGKRSRRPGPGRPEGPDFPHAHVRTFRQLPARCPRDGGPWREVEIGVVCRVCSYERIVAEALRRQALGGKKAAMAANERAALSTIFGWR